MKLIRFKNDWRYSRKGDVIEEGDGVALLLIQRNIAEEVTPGEAGTEGSGQGEGSDAAHNMPPVITRRLSGPNEPAGRMPGRRGGRG